MSSVHVNTCLIYFYLCFWNFSTFVARWLLLILRNIYFYSSTVCIGDISKVKFKQNIFTLSMTFTTLIRGMLASVSLELWCNWVKISVQLGKSNLWSTKRQQLDFPTRPPPCECKPGLYMIWVREDLWRPSDIWFKPDTSGLEWCYMSGVTEVD